MSTTGLMNESERRRLEELWTRFLALESLSDGERNTLAAALERDEVFRKRMMRDLQLDGALRAAGEIERGQEKVVATVKALVTAAGRTEEVVAAVRRQIEAKVAARAAAGTQATQPTNVRPLRPVRVAVAAVLLTGAAAAVVLLRPRVDPGKPQPSIAQNRRSTWSGGPGAEGSRESPKPADRVAPTRARAPIARLDALDGPAYRHNGEGTRRAVPSLEIAAGDWVSTSGEGARARLHGPAGSRIELLGDTVASLAPETTAAEGARLFVAQGKATAAVPAVAAGPALILATPHAIVTGAGTVHLDVRSAVTRVEVRVGRARVSALGVQRGTDVEAGQLALVSANDLQPPRAQTATREALLLIGPDDTKEDPPPPEGLRGSEERVKARLEKLGFTVQVADAGTLTPERAREVALLVLSSSMSSKQLRSWFSELPVPMMVFESTAFEQLGLTGARWRRDLGPAPPLADLVVQNPGHPLAAGLTGNVRVLSPPVGLRWAVPPPSAISIATYAGAPEQSSLLFGYERGAQTASGTAPARRVAMFLGNGRVIRALTESGWRLFDAAALWCTGQ
jgi:hypothetical protein